MRGLTIIIADVSSIRFRAALSLATAHVALGGKARLFLSGEAVSIIRAPISGWDDDDYTAIGQPEMLDLYGEALDAGIAFIVCQTGMALVGAEMSDFDPRVEAGGMVSLLATLRDDRLITV